jgi:hypothetical protein
MVGAGTELPALVQRHFRKHNEPTAKCAGIVSTADLAIAKIRASSADRSVRHGKSGSAAEAPSERIANNAAMLSRFMRKWIWSLGAGTYA